jgi:hypothetical protein
VYIYIYVCVCVCVCVCGGGGVGVCVCVYVCVCSVLMLVGIWRGWDLLPPGLTSGCGDGRQVPIAYKPRPNLAQIAVVRETPVHNVNCAIDDSRRGRRVTIHLQAQLAQHGHPLLHEGLCANGMTAEQT